MLPFSMTHFSTRIKLSLVTLSSIKSGEAGKLRSIVKVMPNLTNTILDFLYVYSHILRKVWVPGYPCILWNTKHYRTATVFWNFFSVAFNRFLHFAFLVPSLPRTIFNYKVKLGTHHNLLAFIIIRVLNFKILK